eukprot:151317-Chlamydomonas_euryale.AAC.6
MVKKAKGLTSGNVRLEARPRSGARAAASRPHCGREQGARGKGQECRSEGAVKRERKACMASANRSVHGRGSEGKGEEGGGLTDHV